MKANAPEKIFIQSFNSNEEDTIYFDAIWTEEPEPGVENIEYTRTDAFIEKATEWLKENADSYTWYNKFERESGMVDGFIEDFREYMKGE